MAHRWGAKAIGSGLLCLSAIALATACGGDGSHDPDGSPGTTADASSPDASPDAAAPPDGAPPADAGADAGADAAPIDAGPDGVSIDSVVTADGFTQIRQGSSAQLIITGSRLDGIDTVTVGELAATVVSAEPTEVRADITVPHGTAPGARDVTVSGPDGSATLAAAIETTFYIIAPGAAPGGRGTFQSPLHLCEDETRAAQPGDTLSLLAGAHECTATPFVSLMSGITVAGQGAAATTVGAAGGFLGFFVSEIVDFGPTLFRDLTVVASEPSSVAISFNSRGAFIVENVVIEGPADDGAGIRIDGPEGKTVTISGLDYRGPGTGIDMPGFFATLTVSESSFSSCLRGVDIRDGQATITDSVFDGCDEGIRIGPEASSSNPPSATVRDCDLVDNVIGIVVASPGGTVVIDTTIRDPEVTEQASQRGIHVGRGTLSMTGGQVSGQDEIGIAVEGSSTTEGFANAFLDGVEVIGGPIGVNLGGFPDDENLFMRNSIIRDQTVAAVRIRADGTFSTADLGNDGGTGGNQLSVVSGVALLDARPNPFEQFLTIDCTGITLNGRSYAGQFIQGPASLLPDYQVDADGILQF